ncbi:hypothetical protein AB0N16_06390 [Streptomyces sp. NPDC051105]|uniref:hypothetical protein n=1 Tax=Streptomyces sp. NPDC051105 TaxID=3154843 RepID=UPI00341F29E6
MNFGAVLCTVVGLGLLGFAVRESAVVRRLPGRGGVHRPDELTPRVRFGAPEGAGTAYSAGSGGQVPGVSTPKA